jgi:ribonuclease-3
LKAEDLSKKIGINFKNKDLLEQVLVHKSFLNENRESKLENNERLEFLGDAVLELIVTRYLYQHFDNPEGELTNLRSALVKGKTLANLAKKFDIGKLLYLSKGEDKGGGRENELLLANAFEALIGAIYLDQGYSTARIFIEKHLISHLPEIIEKNLHIDPKSHIQELAQDEIGITPTYEVLEESGPDHARHFKIGIFLGDKKIGGGEGASKQSAQTAAAEDALAKWEQKNK